MRLVIFLLVAAVLLSSVEAYRVVRFYRDVSASRQGLLSIKDSLDLGEVPQSEAAVLEKQQLLLAASGRLGSAGRFVKSDPLVFIASRLPIIGRQASGLNDLVLAADEAARTGIEASNLALAFARHERGPGQTSIESAMSFLQSQQASVGRLETASSRLRKASDRLPDGLIGPLARAQDDLEGAVSKLEGLVEGYRRANTLLPDLLGYNGVKRYLVLPQNDTELFPSGGLISSYGIATFERGKLTQMDLEYFGTLYDRWQKQSGGEYVEPPGPLKNYLKRHFSWALGEAGWYPDFPTTAAIARDFVQKGGAPPTDGAIAFDLKFISGLLELLGPVKVAEYGVTVTSQNVEEVTLELTRDEDYQPGKPRKAFLSYLAQSVINQVYSTPKERWIDLLRYLDRMGAERHLQLNFGDSRLQALSQEYGFDGALQARQQGDFLLVADTSVNSTKLNLILKPRITLNLQFGEDGSVRSLVTYEIENPYPEWKQGRDPRLVEALMLQGVYGCYVRIYAAPDARLLDVRVDGRSAGPEQVGNELGVSVFGRFFPVMPGSLSSAQFLYRTPSVVQKESGGLYRYRLYIQKEAGTKAVPLEVRTLLPKGAELKEVKVDGLPQPGTAVLTDLRTDREIEIAYTLPR